MTRDDIQANIADGGEAMAPTMHDELLVRAVANVARVHDFFAARRSWRAATGGMGALRSLHDALAEVERVAIDPLLLSQQVDVAAPPHGREAPLPAGELEAERVKRFTAFVEQLRDWFAAQGKVDLTPAGRQHLARLAAEVVATASAVEEILAGHGVKVEPVTAAALSVPVLELPAPRRPAAQPAAAVERALPRADETVADGAVLVLSDTEQNPLLQTFQGMVELTPAAKEAIGDFVQRAGIVYNAYQLDRFQRKVLQWIEATPPGQVLVIKVGGLRGRREPYPSYISKDRRG